MKFRLLATCIAMSLIFGCNESPSNTDPPSSTLSPSENVLDGKTNTQAADAKGEATSINVSSELEVPDGFELQKLELGGEILKPIGWTYESRELGKTLSCKMWEPLPNNAPRFDTIFTIDIVTNTVDAGSTPSKYATTYIESLKKNGTVIKVFEPQATNGMVQSGILMDQKLTITGSEKDYRIRAVLFADDKNELLFVLTFGTLASQWGTYEPTFRVMTKNLKLIDLSKNGKPDK
jgi:hypothetical protein